MQEAAVPLLTTWQNFYVIIGSSAGALTGLMFVVITLVAGTRMRRSSEPIAVFSSPNVVHFCIALLVAALLCAPWQALWNASLLLGLCGLGGMIYIAKVARRARRQTDYTPVLEDWLWHTVFPFASYTALVVTAILLLFIGIHNAWDNVTYVVVELSQPENKSQD